MAAQTTIGRFAVTPPKTTTGRPLKPRGEDETEEQYAARLANREKARRFREQNPTYFRDWHRRNKHRLEKQKESPETIKAKGRRRYANERMWFDSLKTGPCADCGKMFEPCVMDYDHQDGKDKCFCVGQRIGRYSRKRLLAEMAKCDLVCACCHRSRTVARLRRDAPSEDELPQHGNAARQRRANRKRKALLNELRAKPCADCGGEFPPECMDFDHRPGEEKLFSVGVFRRIGLKKLLAEIAKCDVVCANCHRLRTHVERAKAEDRVES